MEMLIGMIYWRVWKPAGMKKSVENEEVGRKHSSRGNRKWRWKVGVESGGENGAVD